MDRDEFLQMIAKLPPGTTILVRGGAAASDDAWNPTIKVFANKSGALTAVVEMDAKNRAHYNYPRKYSGVTEVTDKYFPAT